MHIVDTNKRGLKKKKSDSIEKHEGVTYEAGGFCDKDIEKQELSFFYVFLEVIF